MSWICKKCETENPDRLKVCEVCNSPREPSIKDKLKEKYNAAYNFLIRYQPSLLEAADKGDSKAQFQIAEWFLSHGSEDPSEVNNVIAIFWYLKAANNDYIEAQYKLALCCEEGHGIIRNLNEAKKWYEKAAVLGDEKSKVRYLKIKYNKTYESVIRYRSSWLFKADQGERYYQFLLGEWFNNHHSKSSYTGEAIKWYKEAAETGHYGAMYKLGECYEKAGSFSLAIKWLKKAAEGGNRKSCMKLGQLYLYGGMVNKDVEEALKYYRLVLDEDISAADLCNIGYAFDVGDTVPVDKFKAVEYYRKAAEKGDIVAHYNMGVCYENGVGVSRDIEIAKYWYKKASEQGYNQAQQALDRINPTYNTYHNKTDDGCLGVLLSIVFGIVLALVLS